jgi:hypothetical protein
MRLGTHCPNQSRDGGRPPVHINQLSNATASDPRLVTREMQVIVTFPAEGRERELVLPLSRTDYLITDGAAVPITVTRPDVGGETRGQLPGPNAFLGKCQDLREFHTNLPGRFRPQSVRQAQAWDYGNCDGNIQS